MSSHCTVDTGASPMRQRCRNYSLILAAIAGLAFLMLLWSGAGQRRIAFDADGAFAVIEQLCSPAYEGRLTGSAGNQKAMAYVAAQFREIGLQPFASTGDYTQPFEAYVPELLSVPVLEVRGPGGVIQHYVHYVDFRETYAGRSRPGEVAGKGRAFTSMSALTRPAEPIFLYDNKDRKALDERSLLENGIRGLILKTEDKTIGIRGGAIDQQRFAEAQGFVTLLVKASVMEELKRFVATGCTLRMKSEFSMRWVKTANIVGFLPAAHGKLDDAEVISCHLDHLGKALDGGYYPGALDNASGTGVMLSLARSIAANRSRLSKTFLFVAFNAEEQYLGGSWHMVKQPPLLPNRAEVLNFDMVGSREAVALKLDSAVLSARESRFDPIVANLGNQLRRIADRSHIPLQFDRESYGSDHVPFASRLVPAITFSHFAEGAYHTVHDDIRTIDRDRLGEVGQLALDYLTQNTLRQPLKGLADFFGITALLMALGAGAVEIGLRASVRRRRFRELAGLPDPSPSGPGSVVEGNGALLSGKLLVGVAVFALMLIASSGAFNGSPSLGKRATTDLVTRMKQYEVAFSSRDRMPRPVPSMENDATAESIASRFQALGLKPYRQRPETSREDFFLETRSMIPRQKSAPVLQLLASDGSVLRNYAVDRDFLATTGGHGGGGQTEGPFQVVTTAFDADGSSYPISCIRKAHYQELDEARFAERGIQALLVEGDPSIQPEPDYSDEKNSQLLGGRTFLRYIVSPSVMTEIAEQGSRGARLRVAWDVQFDWIYPKTVIGCIPGRETGGNNELIIAVTLDTPTAMPGKVSPKVNQDTALPIFMAVAETMVQQQLRPKHPIVFIAVNGTYTGHLGARAYRDSPMTFKASRKGHWMGDAEDTYGIVGNYFLEANKASSRFATGRHVVNLVPGLSESPMLYLGSESPFCVLPGEHLAQALSKLAAGKGIPLKTFLEHTDHEHESFSERGNPAVTLALPSGPLERSASMAEILAEFIQTDAVSLAPTPLEWLYLVARALLFALGAAFLTDRLLRFRKARKPRTLDPYTEFLKRPVSASSTDVDRELGA
jgi:hypothetical protein